VCSIFTGQQTKLAVGMFKLAIVVLPETSPLSWLPASRFREGIEAFLKVRPAA